MSDNAFASRCPLDLIRERRLEAYPGEFGPERDICDTTAWLRFKFQISGARVLVYRHYSQRGRMIAGVNVTDTQTNPRSFTPIVRQTFVALGYEIRDTGGDIYQCPRCNGNHSRHRMLRAYARIEKSLRNRR